MFKGYDEYRGILVKKNKTICGEYVFKVKGGKKIIPVKVGKALYNTYQLNSEVTIGCKGKKLINIRLSTQLFTIES